MVLLEAIKNAHHILLSTHKSSDGDGLGSEIAMYHALKKINKNVFFMHIDSIPPRYHFLLESIPSSAFIELNHLENQPTDLALIFDTHEPSLCSPLYENLISRQIPLCFIDHHIKTSQTGYHHHLLVDETASCTGEIVFDLIQKLNISLDKKIATALYASLVFDTQNFKVLRDNSKPFQMASSLLAVGINSQSIQDQLFANWNIEKMNYLSFLIPQVTYYDNQSIAVIRILKKDLNHFQVDAEQITDFVDLFMQIKSLQLAIVIREDSATSHKLSFRSRSTSKARDWSLVFNGGGHTLSAGAWVHQSMAEIEKQIQSLISTSTATK